MAHPGRLQFAHEAVDQHVDAVRQPGEHRTIAAADRVPGMTQHRAAGARPPEELVRDRVEGQLTGIAGVDTTEQRLQQPIGHLGAEPLVDVVADGHIMINCCGRAVRFAGRDPESLSRQDFPQGLELGRHAEQ